MKALVVVGADGFGRETLDIVQAINVVKPTFHIIGVLDDSPSERDLAQLAARGVLHLGRINDWLNEGDEADYTIAIGDPSTRGDLVSSFERVNLSAAKLVHSRAVIGSNTEIGRGTVICAGAQISTNVRIGDHVHINAGVTIGADTVIENYVSIHPAATISGGCFVARRTIVGTGAVVLPGVRVGEGSTVGPAACVMRNVPAKSTLN
jgi:sugar O-acyltransferase (sialic acid O-acetyltransferase NeuD family)